MSSLRYESLTALIILCCSGFPGGMPPPPMPPPGGVPMGGPPTSMAGGPPPRPGNLKLKMIFGLWYFSLIISSSSFGCYSVISFCLTFSSLRRSLHTSEGGSCVKNVLVSLVSKGSTLKGKNLLLRSKFFPFRVDPFL